MKKIISALLVVSLSSLSLTASDKEKGIIYANGVKDTLTIGEKFFSNISVFTNPDKPISLNGYAVMVRATNYDEAKIVRITAIGVKSGYDVKFIRLDGDDVIVFSVLDRNADAVYIQRRLSTFNIATEIKKIDINAKHVNLVGRRMISIISKNFSAVISEKKNRISQLEQYIRTSIKNNLSHLNDNVLNSIDIKKSISNDENFDTSVQSSEPIKCKPSTIIRKASVKKIYLDLSSLQVVNRVVTLKFLKKYKKVKPLNSYSAHHMTIEKVSQQKRIVARNIKKDFKKKIPILSSFPKIYKYLRVHSGITKEGILVLNGRAFKVGSNIQRWKISKINYKTGIVVLDDTYSVKIKSEGR